nr:immunoglobulin light chain junction region [Macaca mulatta]MOV65323.1 immunoglobulin light chain junction region [Macaca mulatta]
CLQNNSYPYSF